MPLTEKQLFERDSKRDIGAELLESIRQVKAGGARLLLSVDDAALFAEALASSPEPSPALERAFARKRALLRSSSTYRAPPHDVITS
jgi:hypothetical protein